MLAAKENTCSAVVHVSRIVIGVIRVKMLIVSECGVRKGSGVLQELGHTITREFHKYTNSQIVTCTTGRREDSWI